MTPTELAAAITATEDIILAACPVTDQTTGKPRDMRPAFGYIRADISKALGYYNATPAQVAASVVDAIKRGANMVAGYQYIGSEGYTGLAAQFAPKGKGVKPGPSAAQIKADALTTANVQQAHDLMDAMKADGTAAGKNFLGLDGKTYDQYTSGYQDAVAALFAAAPAPQPVPPGTPPTGDTTGGTIKPGQGVG